MLPEHLQNLSKSELEAICTKCGICCWVAVPLTKNIDAIVPELHCKFLTKSASGDTLECSVYENRHEKASWCFPLDQAIEKRLLPNECPYVVDLPDYRGKEKIADHLYQIVVPHIRKALVEVGQPECVSDSDWNDFTKPKGLK